MFTPSIINLQNVQKRLFKVAYKMIGEVAASEDIVQETLTIYLTKQQKNELTHVQDIQKYLIKAATNHSLNYLKKIKKERANYYGVWLPEPILHSTEIIDFQLDLDYGLTFLLSRFNPKERAVFILKNAFDFRFKEIGELLELKEATCRKSFQRLKNKLGTVSDSKSINQSAKAQLLKAFLAVGQENGLQQLIAILKEDIVLYTDGGGKVSAAKIPLEGKVICTKFLLGLFKKFGDQLTPVYATVNGAPALQLHTPDGALNTVVYFSLDEFQIEAIYMIRNPDKLGT